MAMFAVQQFQVPKQKPRNRYPLDQLKKIGDGFIIPKARVPKGVLNGLGRRKGMRLSVVTLPDGSKRVVLRGWMKVVRGAVEST